MTDGSKILRCAIYTRKSTEEGLEQEFNSLQAQREAAAACILSQRTAGWAEVPARYDDGGFSGASLERPALKKLLADVEARRIDCLVVDKGERLSRCRLDFARLIELFDRRGVSFVSVTQDFNTTTSLGRLTLNILLSFAQFEREIISERTRDKLGAARRKGKWIGGSPVLGYDLDGGAAGLGGNEEEAADLRAIFEIAAATGSLGATLNEVLARGFLTKEWTSKAGKHHPGRPFSRTTLRLLLSNVLYTGDVAYKGKLYAGEQSAIVDTAVWQKVNEQFAMHLPRQRGRTQRRQHTLLTALLSCGRCDGPMVATNTRKNGRSFEYYACAAARHSKDTLCEQRPVATTDLDSSLIRHLEPSLGTELSAPLIQQALERVTYDSESRRIIVFYRDGARSEYILPRAVRRGVRIGATTDTSRVPRISRVMALAIRMDGLFRGGSVGSFCDLAEVVISVGHACRKSCN